MIQPKAGETHAQVEETFTYSATQDLIGKGIASHNLPTGLSQRITDSIGEVNRAESVLRDKSRVQKVGPYLTYTYDGAGRVLERREEKPGFRPQIQRYTWNGTDQMIGATIERQGRTETWAYTYDALGRRVRKQQTTGGANLSQVDYLWDGNALVAEQNRYADGTQASTLWHYTTDSDFTPVAREHVAGSSSASGLSQPPTHNGQELPPGNYPDDANAHAPISAALLQRVDLR